jgi:hypothetical protein
VRKLFENEPDVTAHDGPQNFSGALNQQAMNLWQTGDSASKAFLTTLPCHLASGQSLAVRP